MSSLVEKLFAIHDSLMGAGLAHAFGGAIALAYCVEEPRGTRDLDVNVFAEAARAESVLASLPSGVRVRKSDIARVRREGQARLDWAGTPIDVFLNNLPLHDAVAAAVRWVPLEGREIPVLDCASLVVFKALFDRGRDWGDIEEIAAVSPRYVEAAAATLGDLLGPDQAPVRRLTQVLAKRG